MPNGANVLGLAVEKLKQHHPVKGWCQHFTDWAITKVSPSHTLPDAPTALLSLHILKADPAKYGYTAVHDLNSHPYTLVYFGNCGGHPTHIPGAGSEFCGHVGIYSRADGMIYSSYHYKYGPYWDARKAGFFVPI